MTNIINNINLSLNKNKIELKKEKKITRKNKNVLRKLIHFNIINSNNKNFIKLCLFKNNKKVKNINGYFNK